MDTSDLANRPWVLLPGTLCTEAVFDSFLNALQVAPALRTFIRMDRPYVEEYRIVFESLPRGAVVCGFSLGAIAAAHHADHITAHSLILFGVNPFPDDPAKTQQRRDLAQDVQIYGGADALRSRPLTVYGPASKKAADLIYQMADSSGDMIEAQTNLALSRPGAIAALSKAAVPVLSLTGSLDQSAPHAQGLAAAQAPQNGHFLNLNGLGHFALLEDPIACGAAVTQLMERHHDTC